VGAARYFRSGLNRFDCAAALLPAAAEGYALAAFGAAVAFDSSIARLVLLSRLLRLGRVFAHSARFRVIAGALQGALPEAGSLFGTLWVLVYTFSLVGVDAFGGTVYSSNERLQGSEYVSSGYLELNFNDMTSGIVTLWCLLVVNDWSVLMEGIILASGRSGLWRLYFMIFYIVAVVVSLGVLTSFIIDSFLASEAAREVRALGIRRLRQSLARLRDEQEHAAAAAESAEAAEEGAEEGGLLPPSKPARFAEEERERAARDARVAELQQQRADILRQNGKLLAANAALLAAQLGSGPESGAAEAAVQLSAAADTTSPEELQLEQQLFT
jgi:hypothetical protein